MSLIKGSLSLCRYKVVGGSKTTESQHNQKLLKFQAQPVSLTTSPKELTAGWVLPPLCETEERNGTYWDLSDCRIDGRYLLRLRVEKRKIPTELFQILLQQRFQEFQAAENRRPGRAEQQEIREEVRTNLMQQALPAISYLDACWKDDGTVLLFHTARKSREIFEELFRATFTRPMQASLVAIDPPLMALSAHQWKHPEGTWKDLEQLERLIPLWLTVPGQHGSRSDFRDA